MPDKLDKIKDTFHSLNNWLNKITILSGHTRYTLETKGIDKERLEDEKRGLVKILSDLEDYALKLGEILKVLRRDLTGRMHKRVLIVDDEENIALVLKELLISKGYEVQAVFRGKEAMEQLVRDKFDLILLDIRIPDINGLEILKEAKRKHPDIKTIVLSGFLEEYKEEIEKIGCDAFLTKPFSIKTLIKVLDSTLAEEKDDKEQLPVLIEDSNILAQARLLFIEPNEIMYSSKLVYFKDPKRARGRYQVDSAFTEDEVVEKLEDFKPHIVLSNISMFRFYKLAEKFAKTLNPPKDIILYGLSGYKGLDKDRHASFISGLFDPITAAVTPKEMDKLGRIVRTTAIAHNLYTRPDKDKGIKGDLKVLIQASKGMVLITDVQRLFNLIVHIVKKYIKIKGASIFQYEEASRGFVLKCRRGEISKDVGHRIGNNNPLVKWLKEKKNVFLSSDSAMPMAVKKELEKLDSAVCVPSFWKGELIGFLILGEKFSGETYTKEEVELFSTLSNGVAIAVENAKNFAELAKLRQKEKKSYFQTVMALAQTVDEKDTYTHGHLGEVYWYGMQVAEELEKVPKFKHAINKDDLETALRLHDIGKIGVPDAVLNKSGKLNIEEWDMMKQHCEIGARIVEPIERLKDVANIIKHHQEKYDGTGYPDGLKGEEIPLESRIIAVVDAYHAMVSDRSYRKALSEKAALRELKNNRKTQFDPLVVGAFLKAHKKGRIKRK